MHRRTVISALSGLGLSAVSGGAPAAGPAPTTGAAPTRTFSGPADSGADRVKLRWAFSVRILFADRFNINSPVPRGYTSAGVGEVWGPRLRGRVLPHSGADYYKATFNTYYMLEADDGARIFLHNRGSKRRFVERPVAGHDPVADPGVGVNAPGGWVRFRVSPTFRAPFGRHNWLNETVIVGNATKHPNPDRTVFTYYEVL